MAFSFSGYPWLRPDPIFEYEFVLNGTDVYYEYTLVNSSVFSSIFPIRCLGTPHMEGSDTQLGDLLYIPGRSV